MQGLATYPVTEKLHLQSIQNMNWIEIDKILHNLYSAWDGQDRETYYRLVERQFKWDRRQAVVATDLIFKQRLSNDYASGEGNDLAQSKKKKTTKKEPATASSGGQSRTVSATTRSRTNNTASGQKRSQVGDKPIARPKRKPKSDQ